MGHIKRRDHNYAGKYFLERDCPPTVRFRAGGVYGIPSRDEIWAKTTGKHGLRPRPPQWRSEVRALGSRK